MYSFISGTLEEKGRDRVIVQTSDGIGYEIFIPAPERDAFPEPPASVRVHTHLYVREDRMKLYGFMNRSTRDFFRHLLPQSGVGPKLALSILSDLGPESFRKAIHQQDMDVLTQVSGVGKKTAKRLIVEMSEKLPAPNGDGEDSEHRSFGEAVEGLMGLGFKKTEASNAVRQALEDLDSSEQVSLEELISRSLNKMDGSS